MAGRGLGPCSGAGYCRPPHPWGHGPPRPGGRKALRPAPPPQAKVEHNQNNGGTPPRVEATQVASDKEVILAAIEASIGVMTMNGELNEALLKALQHAIV